MRPHDILRKLRLDESKATPHLDLRRSLFEILEECNGLEVDEIADRTEAEVAAMEPHLFLGWCRDGDCDYFAAIPESLVSPPLEQALAALRSTTFVGAEDFAPAGFAALVRVYATIVTTLDGVPDGAPGAGLLRWIEQETDAWEDAQRKLLPTADELGALQNVWQSGFSMEPSGYDKRYTRVLSLRQMT